MRKKLVHIMLSAFLIASMLGVQAPALAADTGVNTKTTWLEDIQSDNGSVDLDQLVKDGKISASDIVEVNQSNVKNALNIDSYAFEDKEYFRLTEDVTLNNWSGGSDWDTTSWFSDYVVFDGNGHTITLSGNCYSLFDEITKYAVLENVTIEGTVNLDDKSQCGPICSTLNGVLYNVIVKTDIVNWSADSSGIAGNVNDDARILNCSFQGSFESAADSNEFGGICYNISTSGVVDSCTWIDLPYIKKATVNKWSAAATNCGIYVPAVTSKARFTKDGTTEATAITNGKLTMSITDVTRYVVSTGIAGTLSVEGYATDEVIWLLSEEDYDIYKDMPIGVGKYSGELYVSRAGKAKINAYERATCDQFGEPKEDSNLLETITVTVTNPSNVEKLRVKWGESTAEDGEALTVSGGEWITLQPQALYSESDEWVDVLPSAISFPESDDDGTYMAMKNQYRAKTDAPYTITIQGFGKTATITVKPEHVAVESIQPNFDEVYYLHSRTAEGTYPRLSSGALNNSVTVVPENASNAYNWTMTSSDPKVADYAQSSIQPFAAGNVTITATVKEGETEISGHKEVSFRYLNPLTSVTLVPGLDADTDYPIHIDVDDKENLPLYFEGENTGKGISVSEAGMKWTYSTNGIVRISRASEVKELTVPEIYNQDGTIAEEQTDDTFAATYVSNDKYVITGLKEGAVTVTGTPVDDTAGAQPVVFNVYVGTSESLTAQRAANKVMDTILSADPADAAAVAAAREAYDGLSKAEKALVTNYEDLLILEKEAAVITAEKQLEEAKLALTKAVTPSKPTMKTPKALKKAMKLTWTRPNSKVTGYQVQYATSKTMKSAKSVWVKGASTVTKTVKNLKSSKKYYVRVRAYYTYSGKKYYSSWSTVKSVKVK